VEYSTCGVGKNAEGKFSKEKGRMDTERKRERGEGKKRYAKREGIGPM
jgi:hypothetical protein